jgi:hypothetical protein
MKEFKFNYYEELEQRQKDVLEEKNSAIIYYNYLEDLEDCTLEEKGAMLGALLFYASTHGTEEIPKEYTDIIEGDRGLRKIFKMWQLREAKATSEWCNHRGSYTKKYTYFEFRDGSKKKIKGNVDNAPRNQKDFWFNDCEWREFFEYGNEREWDRPYTELAEEWYNKITGDNENNNSKSNNDLPF